MSRFPRLPLFTDAYLADTQHLSDAEHGRYLLLLMQMWRTPKCRLPNDDAWLARRFNRSIEAVRAELRPIIREFMQSNGNWIWQKRLKREYLYVTDKSENASVSAKARWNNNKKSKTAYAPIPIQERESFFGESQSRPSGKRVRKKPNSEVIAEAEARARARNRTEH